MKLAKDLTEYLESSGYEITKFDYAKTGDLVLTCKNNSVLAKYSVIEYEQAISTVPHFHVRKVPKYRPVRIDDLGSECEFSDYPDFLLPKTGPFVECRRQSGPFGFGMARPNGEIEYFPFCRILDDAN